MRIAVTGATGNIGTRVVDALLADDRVTGVVGIASRLPAGPARDQLDRDRLGWAPVDLGAGSATRELTAALAGCDAAVHLAWLLQPSRDVALMERVNLGGTRAVLAAVTSAGVGALVHASSLGAYSPAPKRPPVTEDAPTGGVPSSPYSVQKAAAERLLDDFEAGAGAGVRVVRVRPALVLQRAAGASQGRYFLGPLVPRQLVSRRLVRALGVLPLPDELTVQVVHAADIADLFARAALDPAARGAYNGAAEPVLDPAAIAAALGVRRVRAPLGLLRGLADATWRAHLQPTDPGWVDLGAQVPLMDTTRARGLGWRPTRDARAVLVEALDGVAAGAGAPTPVLRGR